MTLKKRVFASLTLALAAVWSMSPFAAGSGAGKVPDVQLTSITSKVSAKKAVLVIEATEPASYVTTRPDALTVLLDFRNVSADHVAAMAKLDPDSPIKNVSVEAAESLGTPVSRVRISLARPLPHHVRSARNTVLVDFDRTSDKGAPFVLPPAARQDDAQIDMPALDPIASLGLSGRQAAVGADFVRQVPAAAILRSPAMAPARSPAQAAQTLPSGGGADQSSARTYTGSPISLDFQQADLRAVLRVFSDVSGLNMVIDPAVRGTVDVALKDVPWDQALDIILRANKLGYIVDGTIARIAPLTVLAEEEAQRRKLAEEQALSGDLHVFTKTLSYAKADDLQELLTKSALTARGTVQVDPRTNTLIILDLQEGLDRSSDLLVTLDTPQPQVEIEARIVQTTKSYARQLGVQWGFTGRVDPALGNTTNMAFPNKGVLTGAAATGPQSTAVDMGVRGAPSAVGLALGSINGAFNLDVALSALETSGNARILSTPRVSTQNNIEAEIAQGVQIPYQTVSNNTVTTSFRDAALTLRVKPQITAAGTVIMAISVDNGSRGPDAGSPPQPTINTQRANTTVLVLDGQTTVIGGIYASQENSTNDRTPGLGQVPLLRWLFKRDSISSEDRELLIFITPRIIKG